MCFVQYSTENGSFQGIMGQNMYICGIYVLRLSKRSYMTKDPSAPRDFVIDEG